ncbi:MAG TPA: (p)ppGpp synthetase [Candidatus Hydrogenedentes bacterium]|nr:(p)ppGpp synthetase [Candidatus Hydrogenedentota bacterium]HQE82642.1 (p)ppGpp synthetase [Candidatus Hydrogenedentota bacterium]HQH51886.1 (p)ppGpp synthetase [Candidatus Hydrogenedentota bacterium]HQM49380.1 (p)ppGpp synthetase [Candidatus Hydrogenedentota bacterium]
MRIPQRRKLEIEYLNQAAVYDAVAQRVLHRLQRLITAQGINASIKYRVKSFDSYFEKILRLRRSGAASTLLTDLIGFRIVCPFLSDLDAVQQLIGEHFRVVELETKGAEHSFHEFGYSSIHLMVDLSNEIKPRPIYSTRRVAEIQLRTILQDAWAEVEHELVYKSENTLLDEPMKRKLASLNATLTLSDIIFQEIREYQREVHQRENRRKASVEKGLPSYQTVPGLDEEELTYLQQRDDKPVGPIQLRNELEQLIFEALAAHSSDDFSRAIELYSRALRMKTRRQVRSIIYNHRGMAYLALGKYQHAEKDFTSAIRFNADNFRALNNRALAYRIRKSYRLALEDLDRSIAINAVQAEAYYIRALTYCDLQDHSKAVQDCECVLNINPEFAAARHLKDVILANAAK